MIKLLLKLALIPTAAFFFLLALAFVFGWLETMLEIRRYRKAAQKMTVPQMAVPHSDDCNCEGCHEAYEHHWRQWNVYPLCDYCEAEMLEEIGDLIREAEMEAEFQPALLRRAS